MHPTAPVPVHDPGDGGRLSYYGGRPARGPPGTARKIAVRWVLSYQDERQGYFTSSMFTNRFSAAEIRAASNTRWVW